MIDRFYPQPEELQHVRVGPLGPHIDGFATLVSRQGYCHQNGWQKIRLVADLSQWLTRRRIELTELNERQAVVFLEARWKRVLHHSGEQATITLLLRHLRQAAVIPPAVASAVCSPIDSIEQGYGHFLLQERGVLPVTAGQYLAAARRFLSHRFSTGLIKLKDLRPRDVARFVLHDSSRRGRRSSQLCASALRSFLSYLFQQGRIPTNLAAAVPTVAGWRLSELPRYLEPAQVEKVLRCCDRRRKIGKRDYAILLLLARLELRAGEVGGLTLDDIDWSAGELCVRGKGSRVDRLPLLQDVGKAIVDYLKKGRPTCLSRHLFIQCKAPYERFANSGSIGNVARGALVRAQLDLPHHGAHVFRHSLATRMLGSGASLAQIGQVLRHQLVQTTEIYAKVNLAALRALAQPWPGGAQ